MAWRNKSNPSGKRATFQRLVVGSEVHEAFLRWAHEQYVKNIDFAAGIIQATNQHSTSTQIILFGALLEKIASPLIYLEMDWLKLSKPEQAKYARGKYAEQLARQIQEENRVKDAAQRETNW